MSWEIPTATVPEFKRGRKPKIGVWAIQRGLNTLGLRMVEDGVYGKKTKKQVETFQISKFLIVDGVFGAKSSMAMAESLGASVGQGNLPRGLLLGIVDGESDGLICAINAKTPGGIDCSYCQRRVYEGDYANDAVIERAFDGKYQMNLLKNTLVERYEVFRPREAVWKDEVAWRLATLHHNYPYAADQISKVGQPGLSDYFTTPQKWVMEIGYDPVTKQRIPVKFPDGEDIVTPLEWCWHYSLGSVIHEEPGMMTKNVTDWSVRMSLKPVNTVILIDRDKFTLKVMKRSLLSTKFETAKTYKIAVGAEGYTTPRGLYEVQRRAKNPDWAPPNSQWAADLGYKPGDVISGDDPNNPIRERWIEIHDGVGIHGTLSSESIGTRASHGCIRMRPKDVIALYPQVPVGTLVHIV